MIETELAIKFYEHKYLKNQEVVKQAEAILMSKLKG